MQIGMYGINYRYNLKLYWRQYFPNWEIPTGYHVHHIKPKCTFENKDDPRIHHPSNLIALHPDDHYSIHKNRGDKFVNRKLIVADRIYPPCSEEHKAMLRRINKGRKHTPEAILKIIQAAKDRGFSIEHRKNLSDAAKKRKHTDATKKKLSDANLGKKLSAETRKKMSQSRTGVKRGPYKKRL